MSAFYENHFRARKLARSPEHYAALVEVFCEIDRIAARLALSVPMDHGYVPPLSVVTRDYINARLLAAGVTPVNELRASFDRQRIKSALRRLCPEHLW